LAVRIVRLSVDVQTESGTAGGPPPSASRRAASAAAAAARSAVATSPPLVAAAAAAAALASSSVDGSRDSSTLGSSCAYCCPRADKGESPPMRPSVLYTLSPWRVSQMRRAWLAVMPALHTCSRNEAILPGM